MELRIWRSFRLWWNGERVRRMIIYAIWADVGRLWFHEQTTSCMDLWDLSIHMCIYIYIYHIVDNYMLWYHIYIHSIKFTYNYIICILYDVLQTIIDIDYIYNYIHSIYCKYIHIVYPILAVGSQKPFFKGQPEFYAPQSSPMFYGDSYGVPLYMPLKGWLTGAC